MAVRHARLPGRHPLSSPPLRRLPPGQAGSRGRLGGVRRGAVPPPGPPAGPRPLPGARLRGRAAQPGPVPPARALLAQAQGRAGRGVHRRGPAAGPPRGLRRRRLRPRAGQPPRAVPVPRQPAAPPARRDLAAGGRAGRAGSPPSGRCWGRTSSPWPGCPSCCAPSSCSRCSAAIRPRRRWTRPRCGSCSPGSTERPRCARPTPRSSARPEACSTTPRPAACSATCAGTWTRRGRPAPAPTRSPGRYGRWRCSACSPTPRGAGQPPRGSSTSAPSSWPGCARSPGTGPARSAPRCNVCARRCGPARPPRQRSRPRAGPTRRSSERATSPWSPTRSAGSGEPTAARTPPATATCCSTSSARSSSTAAAAG